MEIKFEAKKVEYTEAGDGEYVQIDFDSEVYPNPNEDQSIYLMISAQYEIPPFRPTVEWYDGKEYDGGVGIREYDLTENNLVLILEKDVIFKINFRTDKKTLKEIKNILSIKTEE